MPIINTVIQGSGGETIIKKEPLLDTNVTPAKNLTSASLNGTGSSDVTNKLPATNTLEVSELCPYFIGREDDTELPELSNIEAVAEGFEGTDWVVDDGTQQLYLNFPKGSITDFPRSMTVPVNARMSYFYPFSNNVYIHGCLVNYTDDGTQKTLKAYVVYNDSKQSEFLLVDGTMTSALLPTGYTYFIYIKDITIPAHTIFTLKPATYTTWTQPNLIADNAYGTITSSGYYNNDYKPYKAPQDSDTCWAVQGSYVGNTWWRWQLPEKLLLNTISSRGRSNEYFAEAQWYTDNTKTTALCEAYVQSATSEVVNGDYREVSEIYFTGYDAGSSNPGLRNLLLNAVKGEHTWVAPEMSYSTTVPDDSLMYYTFSNFMDGSEVIETRKKLFYTRGYESSTWPKAYAKKFYTNYGCTENGTVYTGGAGKSIQLDTLIDFYTANSWEIVMDYTYNGGGTESTIFGQGLGGVDYTNFELVVASDVLKIYGSSNNTSWDVFSNVSTDLTMTTGSNYLLKMTYDSTDGYEVLYSQDSGSSWTSCYTSATTTKLRCIKPFCLLANGYNTSSYYSNGSMDISKCYIKVNGETVWVPSTTGTTYVSDGCIVNYTDTGVATTLKAYLVTFTTGEKDIVLSPDDTFTITGMSSKAYLKDVAVPAHTLYSYTLTKMPWTGQPILAANGVAGGETFAAWASSEGQYVTGEDPETYEPIYETGYAYKALDDSTGSEMYYYELATTNSWLAGSYGSGQWLAWYSPDDLYIQSITITNPYFYGEESYIYEGNKFMKGKLQASLDNSTWVDLTSEFTNSAGSHESFTVSVGSEVKYKYFRLYHTGTESTAGISEINISAISLGYGWVPTNMAYTVTENTDKPYTYNFNDFCLADSSVFYAKSKLFADFHYKGASETKSDALLVNYTDTGAAVTLNAYVITYTDGYQDIVLSPDDTFTLTDVTAKELVGTVSIGAHSIYTYESQHLNYKIQSPFDNLETENDFINFKTFLGSGKFVIDGTVVRVADAYNTDSCNTTSYIRFSSTSTVDITMVSRVDSGGNYDFGYAYVGTQRYEPGVSEVREGTVDGHGSFLMRDSGEHSETTTSTMTAAAGTQYFNFGWVRDGGGSSGTNNYYITSIEFDTDTSTWVEVNS